MTKLWIYGRWNSLTFAQFSAIWDGMIHFDRYITRETWIESTGIFYFKIKFMSADI